MVVVSPALVVWWLRAAQILSSTWLAIAAGIGLSVAVSAGGNSYWMNSGSARDVLFSDLMIWGWLRRWRAERALSAALSHAKPGIHCC